MDTTYQTILAHTPPGLDRAILSVLAEHRGREAAIGREALVRELKARSCIAHERQVREQIKQLRREGNLIGSAPGSDGGYYLITTQAEYEEFDRQEFEAKISDMAQTRAAMNKAARQMFGQATQASLF